MPDSTDRSTSAARPSSEAPLVSCLMVTANRAALARRAVRCYLQQTYPRTELVVIDDGEEPMDEVLAEVPASELVYHKLERTPESTLGKLRNVSLDAARGDYLLHWDDDDWYHPTRAAEQAAVLDAGHDVCTLQSSLMHLDEPDYFYHPYIGRLKDGVPGSVMHRRDDAIRYPELRRGEDTIYLDEWREKRYAKLPERQAHLQIRVFHGSNTWEQDHFLRRVRNSPLAALAYAWHAGVRRDPFGHPRFRLTPEQREAFEQYLDESVELGLLERPA
jgi:glycosyltransferase involved in cell wall biosynthesis